MMEKDQHAGCLPDLLKKYIVISIFITYYCLSFLKGIVIYEGCENEGRVMCWEKGFVV